QCVWFDRGVEPGRLLLVAHHLVVDGVSWRIIGADLAAAARGERPAPAGTPFRAWSLGLREVAVARRADLDYWRAVTAGPAPRASEPPWGTAGSQRRVSVALDAARTAALLTVVPETFR